MTPCSAGLRLEQADRLGRERIHVDPVAHRGLALHQVADAAHDLPRAQALARDLLEGLPQRVGVDGCRCAAAGRRPGRSW